MTPPEPPEDPRVRFAAERTLLAWVRTGLALMGFGFVVARAGAIFHASPAAEPATGVRAGDGSPIFGVALVLLGVLVNVLAGLEYRAVLARIDRREAYHPPGWSLGLVVAVLLAAFGTALVGYLIAA